MLKFAPKYAEIIIAPVKLRIKVLENIKKFLTKESKLWYNYLQIV